MQVLMEVVLCAEALSTTRICTMGSYLGLRPGKLHPAKAALR